MPARVPRPVVLGAGAVLLALGGAVVVVLLLVVLPLPTALGVLGAVLVLGGAAVVATRDVGVLEPPPVDRPRPSLPDARVTADDVAGVRLTMALRGYRMDEVDEVLERLAAELSRRDEAERALASRLSEQDARLAEQDARLAEQDARLAAQEEAFAALKDRALRRDA